jgi:cephalosporin hydroxylase
MKNPLGQRLAFRRDDTLKQYWKARLVLHHFDMYRGVHIAKLPEDLRTFEHVIWETQPKFIVELGGGSVGASALWFADRLQTLCGGGKVISIEQEPMRSDFPATKAAVEDPRITFITGDLTDKEVVSKVKRMVRKQPTMVIEDSRHDYDTTLAALRLYSPLVREGQFFVVEDTIVDDAEVSIFGDHGVVPAIDTFLTEESRFVRQNLDLYGITMHSGGWLQAVSE